MNKIIKTFYKQISWASECNIIKIDNLELVKTNLCLYLPCTKNLAQHFSPIIAHYALQEKLKPGLIIGGNPSAAEAEQIFITEARKGVLTEFIDPIAQVAQSQCILSALDGLDWGRTIESMSKGINQAIWEWD